MLAASEEEASEEEEERYLCKDYWLELVEHRLHIEDGRLLRRCDVPLIVERASCVRPSLCRLGFCEVEVSKKEEDDDFEEVPLGWGVSLEDMCFAMERLTDAGWPALYVLVFDESWILRERVGSLMKVEGLKPNFDFAAFVVKGASEAGWAPHRDREDAAHIGKVADGFETDDFPKFVTCWIALSDATPSSSCLYALPKPQDPHYSSGQSELNTINAAFRHPSDLQSIRALPCAQGNLLLFSHRIIHWGSRRCEADTDRPRIAISFGSTPASGDRGPFANSSVASGEPFRDRQRPLKSLTPRLALAAAQYLTYAPNTPGPVSEAVLRIHENFVFHEDDLFKPDFHAHLRRAATAARNRLQLSASSK